MARARMLLVCALLLTACGREARRENGVALPALEPEGALLLPPSDIQGLTFPTRQTRLTDTNLVGVYQATASGNPESGMYGSVRLGNYGKLILPRFHEGLDIAALERDRQGRPLDEIYAAMHGRVAMINRTAGNSDFGIHLVLLHEDPVGTFYTLYAHMASIDAALREGQVVEPGRRLGIMGNTALTPIPMSRAHLHFEIGLIANDRFLTWPELPKKHTPGGKYNGQNLWGLNPMLVFREAEATGGQFTLLEFIGRTATAFELVVRVGRLPEYFRRYPALWNGPPVFAGIAVLSVSEGGVLLAGRPASEEEAAALGRQSRAVLRVDETELGRNGRRIIVKRNSRWEIGNNGETWLSLLLH
ncbi:MAG TPA: M23 family metallopeptidase [Kiritimatiellia bacterium]|nr:M23 family metallopeptidase [Kiritimatiellia bacterium]